MTGKLHLQLAAAAIAMSLGLAAPAPGARTSQHAGRQDFTEQFRFPRRLIP